MTAPYGWSPPPPPPDEFAEYTPEGAEYPRIEVFEGSYRRKITIDGWANIERFYSVKWFDVTVIGGDSLHGHFEIVANGRTLARLVRQGSLSKPGADRCEGACPKCGVVGRFIRMALVCPSHGAYAGC